jgi:hypothetical protein
MDMFYRNAILDMADRTIPHSISPQVSKLALIFRVTNRRPVTNPPGAASLKIGFDFSLNGIAGPSAGIGAYAAAPPPPTAGSPKCRQNAAKAPNPNPGRTFSGGRLKEISGRRQLRFVNFA